MIDLKAKPFFLHDEDIRWVEETLTSMTLEQKAGQVFCPMGFSADPGLLRHLVNDIGVGGMMYRPGFAAEIQDTHRTIQSLAKIPLLLAANTERGGDGLAFEGTSFGQPMAAAAARRARLWASTGASRPSWISIMSSTTRLPTSAPSAAMWSA